MASNENWGEATSGLEVARVFSDQIRGKNVVITGVAPDGIGESTSIAIASQKPSVLILASRTKERMTAVAEKIEASYPGVKVRVVVLDLASQASIRNAGLETAELVPKVDLLINNAGIFVMQSRQLTKEGLEIQFGANHIGHFLFTKLLLPLLKAGAKDSAPGATRIINLSSQGHRLSPIRFSDYNMEGKQVPAEEAPASPMPPAFGRRMPDGYLPVIAYGQCKTANVLFSLSLQQRLKPFGITSYAVHPGGIHTQLGRDEDDEHRAAIAKGISYWKSLDEGSSTTLVAALDPKLNGTYAELPFAPCG
ncbi:uncharacterized protein JN550_013656 [Neoarthrinium moseri]|uniref:uncharacterized protein n=1 Tax=Neoarthrinium moseri TaxID=1658444 RepID=UPI001FDB2E13|nr:uncharacterized protein JN550_013656 [Neoarthrinium moseri]KAI1856854.1 hypothetical protein JN550_013656 [Neoarthrinium moseri]